MELIDTHIKSLLAKKDLQNPTSFEELGYIFFGPLVFNFFAWLALELDDCELVLFNSREGYFLQQIYKIFQEKYNLPKSEYFKTSRKISSIVSFFNSTDVYKTFELHRYSGKLSNLLSDRFGISPNIKLDTLIDTNKEIPNIDEYIVEILENSKKVRNQYKNYIESIIRNNTNIVMVDSGFQGTTQYNIQKTYGLPLIGRYFNYKGNPKLSDVKGFYDFEKTNFAKNIIFFESVFIDNVGSYIGMNDTEFTNEKIDVDLQHFNEKTKIISGIIEFIKDMFHYEIDFKNISYEYSDNIFNLMCTPNYIKNKKLFDIFFHDNYYVRDTMKKIVRH